MSETGRRWGEGDPKKVVRFVEAHPGAFVRPNEVRGVEPAAASKTLSELARRGEVERVRKGLYYVPKPTLVGMSRPSPQAVAKTVLEGKARPTGLTAANLLGLTTQVPVRDEMAVAAAALPKGSSGATVRLRRRAVRDGLEPRDAALLELLRDRARASELGEVETVEALRRLVTEPAMPRRRLRRLRDAALNEPPRVRAIFGALLQAVGWSEAEWKPLRRSLNALSKFDFGLFRRLPNAREWQAK